MSTPFFCSWISYAHGHLLKRIQYYGNAMNLVCCMYSIIKRIMSVFTQSMHSAQQIMNISAPLIMHFHARPALRLHLYVRGSKHIIGVSKDSQLWDVHRKRDIPHYTHTMTPAFEAAHALPFGLLIGHQCWSMYYNSQVNWLQLVSVSTTVKQFLTERWVQIYKCTVDNDWSSSLRMLWQEDECTCATLSTRVCV